VPTQFSIAVGELLDRATRALDETDREARKRSVFEQRLGEIREEADIQDNWQESMVPPNL
jgi:hypothetical protein